MTEDKYYKGFRIRQLADALTNKKWFLILLPTERCNCRCQYCYEDFALGKMSASVVAAIKKLIQYRTSNNELKHFTLAWFGGEPLLAKEIIYDLNEFTQNLSNNGKNFNFLSDITTNGYLLTLPVFTKLVTLGATQYQIALDGPQKLHDQTRPLANGQGTFDTIWANLLAIKESKLKFEIILRLHVHANNYKQVPALIDKIKTTFNNDKRFKVFIRKVSQLGGPNDNNQNLFPPDKSWEKEIPKLCDSLGDGIEQWKLNTKEHGQYICYASQPNAMVIRSNGTLAKCTVALHNDKNNIGKINNDGTLTIDKEKLTFWLNGFNGINPEKLYCPYSQLIDKPCE
jgi:uncharacterized protein